MHAALLLLAPVLAASAAAADGCRPERSSPVAAIADSLRDASGEWHENAVLPYRGEWLDAGEVLDGLAQQDGLRSTRHDGEKCGAMVALAAAVVGGRERFDALLARLEKKAPRRAQEPLALARKRFAAGRLTAGDLHRVSEILYDTYVGGLEGSSDGDISTMIRASGLTRVATGARTPRELFEALGPGELFPLNLYLEQPGFVGWHVVLVWKDAQGRGWVYDSDKFRGPQVFRGDGRAFSEAYLDAVSPGEHIPAEWKPGTLFR